MKKLLLSLTALISITFLWSSASRAYTVTFDDVAPGQDLSYYFQQYGLKMLPGWQVVDSASAGWGTPQSGTQSVIWNGALDHGAAVYFGADGVSEYKVRSVGAYFTTPPGVLLQIRGLTLVGTITAPVGSAEGWTNHYVQINTAPVLGIWGAIGSFCIVGVSSTDARYHFSMDNLTIVPVPEPSSLLALLAGLGGCGVLLRRRLR